MLIKRRVQGAYKHGDHLLIIQMGLHLENNISPSLSDFKRIYNIIDIIRILTLINSYYLRGYITYQLVALKRIYSLSTLDHHVQQQHYYNNLVIISLLHNKSTFTINTNSHNLGFKSLQHQKSLHTNSHFINFVKW